MPHVETLPLAEGLNPDELHRAHIEAERGWDQWAVVGFAVGSTVDTTASDLLAGALGLIALGCLGGALCLGRGLPWGIALSWLTDRIGAGLHLALSLGAALAVWLGAALTWGGLIPDLTRRLGDGPSLLLTALTAGLFYFSPWLVLLGPPSGWR
jgi:hypothetical protein